MTTTDVLIAPRATQIQPLDLRETRAMMTAYQQGLREIVDEDDYQAFRGRDGETNKFLKRSGWRKIATWFGLDLEIRSRDLERGEDDRIIRAHVVVRAIAPNGRYADGDGGCSITERGFSKAEHDIPATATTRATNRAISNLVGMGSMSAEELDGTSVSATPTSVITAGEAKELAAALQRQWPSFDGFEFLRVLRRSFADAGIDGVPEAAKQALEGWIFWVGQPLQSATEAAETGGERPVGGATEETTA